MNFTWRARSLLTLAGAALAFGLVFRQEPLALGGLTIVLWIGFEWANFCWRTTSVVQPFTSPRRTVGQQSRGSLVLVAGQPSEVALEVSASKRLAGLRCTIEDAVPNGLAVSDGSPQLVADLRGGETLRWRYALRPAVTRRTCLPGLQVVLSDPQGLFRTQRFLPLRQELTVFPFMVRPQATVSVLKQQNVQLLPGLHRHRRPGNSNELLGIRDYRPGDPPRSLAWKATARLDRLMTREYESEAPVRATLLTDLSPIQFLGRPGPARADRIVSACASLARLLLSDGDPIACLVVSRDDSTWLPHGLGERHLSRLLLRLLSYSEPLSLDNLEVRTLTHLAWTCGFRRFPELFDDAVNYAPVSSFTIGRRRQAVKQRRQLSAVLAELHRGPPHLAMRLQFDDPLYREHCRRLLEDYPGTVDLAPLHERPPIARDEESKTIGAVCRGLLAGVARANDNELFAILGTVPREAANLEQLVAAARVARAEHHRVLMIDVAGEPAFERFVDPTAREALADIREQAEVERFAELERRLTRLGARIARLHDPRLMEKVAAEIEILRSGRARTMRGAR